MVIKLYKILYYTILKIINFFVFNLLNFLKFFDLYFSSLKNFYIHLAYGYIEKNKIYKSKKLATYIVEKNLAELDTATFLAPIFENSGDPELGKLLHKIQFYKKKINISLFNLSEHYAVYPEYFSKIGHFPYITFLAKAIRLNLVKKRKIFIYGPFTKYNKSLLELYSKLPEIKIINQTIDPKKFNIIKKNLGLSLDAMEYKNDILKLPNFLYLVNKQWEKTFKKKKILKFSKIDRIKKEKLLKNFGIDKKNNWYVVINVRENFYSKFSSLRNASFESYNKAISFIISKGGHVIRLGDKPLKKIKNNNKFIDLSTTNLQTDLIPFLIANCKFSIMTGSGPSIYSAVFNTPKLMTNWVPLAGVDGSKIDHILPKMLYRNGKIINFANRLKNPYATNTDLSYYKQLNVKVIENSEEDILNGVKEMYKIHVLNKKNRLSKNQKQIHKIFEDSFLPPISMSSIVEKNYPDFLV